MINLTKLLVLCFLTIQSEAAFSEYRERAQRLDHSIKEATTFPNNAMVKRSARFVVKKGENWFQLGSLPNRLDPSTLKLKLRNAKASIEQIIVERQYEKRILRSQVRNLMDQLRIYYGQLLELQQIEYLQAQQKQYLQSIDFAAPFPKSGSENKYQTFSVSMSAVSRAMTLLRQERNSLMTKIQKNQESIRIRRDKIEILHKQIQQYVGNRRHEQVINVFVRINGEKSSKGIIEFDYMMPNASWRPAYDVRAMLNRNRGVAEIEIVYSGLLTQQTSEDWNSIDLTVSTVNPAPLFVPKLNTWKFAENRVEEKRKSKFTFGGVAGNAESAVMADSIEESIDAGRAQLKRSSRSRRVKAKKMKEGQMASSPSALSEIRKDANFSDDLGNMNNGTQTFQRVAGKKIGVRKDIFRVRSLQDAFPNYGRLLASVNSAKSEKANIQAIDILARKGAIGKIRGNSGDLGERRIEIRSPLSVSLPSGKEEQRIPLAVKKVSGKLSYYSVPKQDPRVFLRAKTKNTTSMPLLQGNANVYMDGSLVSTTNLGNINEGSTFWLDLGVDKNVETKRVVKKKAKDSGVLFKKHVTEVAVSLEVMNRHDFPISIELKDQIPVSTNEKIKIELSQSLPASEKKKDGIMTWKLTIPPRKKEAVNFSYLVTHPSDYIVSELN